MVDQLLLKVWRFISETPFWFSLLMLLLTSFFSTYIWKIDINKKGKLIVFLTMLFFGLADWLVLALLPILHLSYGPVGLSLLSFISIRFALFLVWFLIMPGKKKLKQPSPEYRKIMGSVLIIWLLNIAVSLCQLDGYYFEPFNVQTTKLAITSPFPVSVNSIRIVQLSDLHIERITKREERVISEVKKLKPDIIFLTGDYLNTSFLHDELAKKELAFFLDSLEAPRGIYAVISYQVDKPDVQKLLAGSPKVKLLNNTIEKITFDKGDIFLIGVSHHFACLGDENTLTQLCTKVPSNAYTILLYHSPDIIDTAADNNINLYLAGHTHGGQIRVPFFGAVISASRYYKKYEIGLYQVKQTKLYVNRGLGMEGLGAPRARFLCAPEIVVIDIK